MNIHLIRIRALASVILMIFSMFLILCPKIVYGQTLVITENSESGAESEKIEKLSQSVLTTSPELAKTLKELSRLIKQSEELILQLQMISIRLQQPCTFAARIEDGVKYMKDGLSAEENIVWGAILLSFILLLGSYLVTGALSAPVKKPRQRE